MTITADELSKLSLSELGDLIDTIKDLMQHKREDQYSEAREKMDEIALTVGLSAVELLEKTEKPERSARINRDDNYHP